ncbi:MAG: acyl dehydratase [Chloroflexi bacterium]|nr:acyl dehydratase [Chloroflexota bacterium]MCH8225651.1 acyl dehydratase [Chloroflexota bacterium]MCI0846689.1 acyl dehydratase [Chloroflexota bacterium]
MTIALEELLKLSAEEIWARNERPTAQQLRDKQQTFYEDIDEGMELPKYIYRPTPTHLFRWSAAIENFHRIHYDLDFGLNHDKNPSILVHGSWKQSVVPQYLKDWTLPKGWPWKAQFEHRAMLVPGDVLIMWGRVTGKQEKGGMGLIDLEIGMKTHDGIESMPGSATVVLPLKGGPDIPYPFVPPKD